MTTKPADSPPSPARRGSTPPSPTTAPTSVEWDTTEAASFFEHKLCPLLIITIMPPTMLIFGFITTLTPSTFGSFIALGQERGEVAALHLGAAAAAHNLHGRARGVSVARVLEWQAQQVQRVQ